LSSDAKWNNHIENIILSVTYVGACPFFMLWNNWRFLLCLLLQRVVHPVSECNVYVFVKIVNPVTNKLWNRVDQFDRNLDTLTKLKKKTFERNSQITQNVSRNICWRFGSRTLNRYRSLISISLVSVWEVNFVLFNSTRGLISCYQSFAPMADIAVAFPVFTHGQHWRYYL
jgi:hypothetical protein